MDDDNEWQLQIDDVQLSAEGRANLERMMGGRQNDGNEDDDMEE